MQSLKSFLDQLANLAPNVVRFDVAALVAWVVYANHLSLSAQTQADLVGAGMIAWAVFRLGWHFVESKYNLGK